MLWEHLSHSTLSRNALGVLESFATQFDQCGSNLYMVELYYKPLRLNALSNMEYDGNVGFEQQDCSRQGQI